MGERNDPNIMKENQANQWNLYLDLHLEVECLITCKF